ncbi:PTS sugar transporter subunit IIB [Dictyoglomus thermophilum]|uniref:PTS system, mannitol/fructose-specific enzyme II, B component n=1 Tax=Dictyoglomus thermophilum (strain ATCC 35947 / DSM 3960 / H-6-12) TaxID=309799 RepID=B5YAZ8_DICT6|nr:PTS sugar transporter subunit IIB [Dictyoglomus thermophilum]ACI18504.1 PTS system, mannitol/fructose-specific enzyme II, B component [Dictyoglomus thermophilum H-6-12]MCX7721158.1 PTS sugar transporter subunit IIB [Dictyoglomus thermophilum]
MDKKRIKILAVCGMGLGSSLVLKMTIEKALKELGLEGDVQTADIVTAKGAGLDVDVIITSKELAEQLGEVKVPIVTVKNYVNVKEFVEGLKRVLNL